jgi:hypothetical protein
MTLSIVAGRTLLIRNPCEYAALYRRIPLLCSNGPAVVARQGKTNE